MAQNQILSDDRGMLYVVATPIGNLGDITLRALEVLKLVDAIAAEDTRHSGMLLKHFGIKKPLVSFHEHNEAMRTAQLIERIVAGENLALVSDAGTPGLSDPGARLIRACIRRNLPFTVVPGPSSILTALVGSGFSTEKFFFGGFLPSKSGGRERELRAAAARDETTVFFESPHRLTKTLAAAVEILPHRQLCVARELTKKFEEYRRGSAAELFAHYEAHPAKGEIVLLVQGAAVSRLPTILDRAQPVANSEGRQSETAAP
jgi:16S rRNA (cytidine1402-2'-O)-methyltransferase